MHSFRIASAAFPAALGAAVLALAPHVSFAAPVTEVIAVGGDPAPDADGSFYLFSNPSLNDAGHVAFLAFLTDTSEGSSDHGRIYRGDAATLVEVLRKGQDAPDGNGSFSEFNAPALNETGQAAFFGVLSGTSGGTNDDRGIFRGDGATLVSLAREGQAAPDGNGSFSGFSTFPAFNDAGQAAFRGGLRDTSGGGEETSGIFRGDGTTLAQVARGDQPAPDGNGNFYSFDFPTLNNAGQVAFRGVLDNTSGGASDTAGLFRGDGETLVQIARAGQSVPGGNGTFIDFVVPSLNDSGQAAFVADIASDGTDDHGIFRGDGAALVQIARQGQAVPDGNGTFSFLFAPALNNEGQAVFSANLAETTGGSSDSRGIFRGDGLTLEQLARAGQASPDGNGSFTGFLDLAVNDAGQAAFLGLLTGTSGGTSDDSGIFFYDDGLGLLSVVREGDELLGSTITDLLFEDSVGTGGDERGGLNELGQVAYRFTLADGRQGLAVSLVPEPGGLGLLALGAMGLLRRCRREPR